MPIILLHTGLTQTECCAHPKTSIRGSSYFKERKKLEVFLGVRPRPTRLMSFLDSSTSNSRPPKFSTLNPDTCLQRVMETWLPLQEGRMPPSDDTSKITVLFRATDRLPIGAVIILHRLFVSLILSPLRPFSSIHHGVLSQTFMSREPHVSLCCLLSISWSCTYVTANCTLQLTALTFPVSRRKARKATANYREWAFIIQVAKVLRGQWDQKVHNFSIVWLLNIVYYVDFINLQVILWEPVKRWLPVFVYGANTAEVQFSSTF
jgi:hypothetical protein